MTGIRRRLAIAAALAIVAVPRAGARQDAPVFKAAADLVRIDVSVTQRGRPITTLQAGDFEILDNGVPQRIADFSYEKMPIDVTIAFDISRSVTGQVLAELRRAVDEVRGRLRAGDRLKLVTFNMRVRRLLDVSDRIVDTKGAFDRVSPSGSTALLDAVSVALAAPAPVDRRQLVIAFSDGLDTASITSVPMLLDVARHTTAAVAFVLPALIAAAPFSVVGMPPADPSRTAPMPMPAPGIGRAPIGAAVSPVYQAIARETGGMVLPANVGALSLTFTEALDRFRAVYVMHFSPSGAAAKGFHELRVRVTRKGTYDINARRGYVE